MGNASGRMWFVAGVLAAAAVAAYLALVPLTRSLGPDASIPTLVTIASSDQTVALAPTDFVDAGGSSTFVRAIPKKPKAKPPVVAAQSTGEPRSATALVNSGGSSTGGSSTGGSSAGATADSSSGGTTTNTPPATRSGSIGESGETVTDDGLASGGSDGGSTGEVIEVGSSGELAP